MNNPRQAIAILALSAAGFAGIALQEGFTDHAVVPVPGDVPTFGIGSTQRDDGSPVKIGDTITPQKAIALAVRDVSMKEVVLRKCFGGARLTQAEYDAYVDLAYNVGPGAVCRSSIPSKVQRQEYASACRTILDFRRAQGRDCSLPEYKRTCGGIWTRRQETYRLCMAGVDATGG